MLGVMALLMIGGMLAMPVIFDGDDSTSDDEPEPSTPDVSDLELEPEAEGQPATDTRSATDAAGGTEVASDPEGILAPFPGHHLGSGCDEVPAVTVETDPITGAVNITVAPDAEGRLMAVFEDSFIIPGHESSSGGRAYGMTLLWVPEGIDFQQAANSHDWQSFFNSYREAGVTPERADYFAAIGVDLVEHWDLGERGYLDSADGAFGDWPYAQDRFDDRTLLPEITANQDIEWFELSGQDDLLSVMSVNGLEMVPAEAQENLMFDFRISVESYREGPWTNGDVTRYSAENGDVIAGTDFDDVIDNPPGDPTAVTIMGGAGEDKISAGLNDTIITNDDTDTDTIRIDSPASFARIYDEVPVIEAGPEDVIEIEASDSLVITFAQDDGNGVTTYFYHVISALGGFELPSEVLEANDAPLTLQDYYDIIGAQLLARGSLGSIDDSDSGNPIDTRVEAPRFEGVDLGFFTGALSGGTVTASTSFTPATGVTAFA